MTRAFFALLLCISVWAGMTHAQSKSREAIIERLEELRDEQAKGVELVKMQETELNELKQQLLRIAGAIGVLEEMLAELPED